MSRYTDPEFIEAFDGATKSEVREYLAAYELCMMPYWGAEELATAIHASDDGRAEAQALRAITLAQKAQELPDFFTPKNGIEWAMDRGYLCGKYARFSGAAIGTYGHPSRPLNDGPHHNQKPPTTDTAMPASEAASEVHDIAERSPVKRRTWRDIAWLYVVETFKAGQYSTAKNLYKALENKAGVSDSPFERGTGVNSHSLYVREVSETVKLKTIQNAWADIKASR